MAGKSYKHSAYWYAKNYGWTHSERETFIGRYLDEHRYGGYSKEDEFSIAEFFRRPSLASAAMGPAGIDIGRYRNLNPVLMGILVSVDIGVAIKDGIEKLADPFEREKMKARLMQQLRKARRPLYYRQETLRRRMLAIERRKVAKRRTLMPMPTPQEVREAWAKRKESREAMVRFGAMMDDLACHVDSCLKFDENGNVIGRNGGIVGWLRACVPELVPQYKNVMRYKALATRIRQATGMKEPHSAMETLDMPRSKVMKDLLDGKEAVFTKFFEEVDRLISPDTVFLDMPTRLPEKKKRRKRR